MKKLIIILLILNSFQIVTVAQITITETRNDTDIVYTTDRRGYVTDIKVIPPAKKSKTTEGEGGYTTCPQTYNTTTITTSASQEEIERKRRNKQRRRVFANATLDALLGTSVIIMQDSYRMRGY